MCEAALDTEADQGNPRMASRAGMSTMRTTTLGDLMQTPLQITFRHMEPSAAVEARVREHVERLERFNERIISCRVVVETPPAHRNKGAPFQIKVDLAIPGRDISVHGARAERADHMDVYVALRDAFDSARRILQDHAREQRDGIKHHERPEA
jgi:ribosomal subunit interface protein